MRFILSVYALIIYPAGEIVVVTAKLPPEIKAAAAAAAIRRRSNPRKSKQLCKVNAVPHILSWSHTSDPITLRHLLQYPERERGGGGGGKQEVNQLNYPRDQRNAWFSYLFDGRIWRDTEEL